MAKRKQRIWPFRNVGIKIMAIFIAILLWISAKGSETVMISLPLDLKINSTPDSLVLVNEKQLPEKINVTMIGPLAELFKLAITWGFISVSPAEIKSGEFKHIITASDIKFPVYLEIQIQDIAPPRELVLEYAVKDSIIVPIEVAFKNPPPENYIVKGTSVLLPEKVKIIGPKKFLKSVNSVEAGPIDLNNRKSMFKDTITLALDDCSSCKFKPEEVIVTIPIDQVHERLITGVPITIDSAQSTYLIEPDRADLRITGAKELIDSITTQDIQVVLKPKEWVAGQQYSLSAIVNLPDSNIKLKSIEPSEFLLIIPAVETGSLQ